MDSKYRTCTASEPPFQADEECLSVGQMLEFLQAAASLSGKGPLAIAVMLLARSFRLKRTQRLLITPRTLREYGFSRATVYRSLGQLEAAAVITVHRRRGCGPQVSLHMNFHNAEAADAD